VFKALTDPAAQAKWFAGGNGYTLLAREMDVRPGGGVWPVAVLMIHDRLSIPVIFKGDQYVVDSLRSPVRFILLEGIDRLV
jgi:hypothetical protein